MTKHVSVDIETLGTAPGSAVIAIGAIVFDPDQGALDYGKVFYRSFARDSLQGFTIDPKTEEWWADQSEEAKHMLTINNVMIKQGLEDFARWWQSVEGDNFDPKNPARFWAKPPSFDEVLTDAAYKIVGIKTPWHYRAPRCVRTILDVARTQERDFVGIEHYALDDAIHQAYTVCDAYRGIRG